MSIYRCCNHSTILSILLLIIINNFFDDHIQKITASRFDGNQSPQEWNIGKEKIGPNGFYLFICFFFCSIDDFIFIFFCCCSSFSTIDCDPLIIKPGEYSVEIGEELVDRECRIYILAEKAQTFVMINYLHGTVKCDNDDEYVNLFDGWFWYDQYFPVQRDRKKTKWNPNKQICVKGQSIKKISYEMSQNAAMFYYRIKRVNTGFSFSVHFRNRSFGKFVF